MLNNLNYFVILKTKGDSLEIRRLQLTQETKEQLSFSFSEGFSKIFAEELAHVEFNGSYKSKKGKINLIRDFQLADEILLAIKNPTSIKPLEIEHDIILRIQSIFAGEIDEEKSIVGFKNFTKANYISKEGQINIFHNGNQFSKVEGPGINIASGIDVLLADGNLYFWNYWTARQALELTQYYREATDEDLEDFIDNPVIKVEDSDNFKTNSDSWVRRKVAMLSDSDIFDKNNPAMIAKKAEQFGVEVLVTSEEELEQIIIPNNKEQLKNVLRFLDEDYYSGPLTDTKYVSKLKKEVTN